MKMLTLKDLYNYCKSENLTHFSSNESGNKIYVQVPTTFAKFESDEFTLYAYIKLFHTGRNRNGSNVTDNASKHMLDTLAYKPLLANFTDVNGDWDFTSHDFIEWEDKDGNIQREFQEKQIGCFTADKPYMEYDKEFDKDYAYAKVAIPRDYTKAAEIIERKNGTKVSIELEILEMSFSGKDNVLNIDDAVITGCTCLGVNPKTGEPIGEGMVDAHISLESFNEKNNSVFTQELVEELKRFNKNFENLNLNNNIKQGGQEMNLFEELLTKYNVTVEDVTFEYENLSDEELEKAFAEAFNENEAEGNEPEENSEEEQAENQSDEQFDGESEGEGTDEGTEGSEPDDNQNEGEDESNADEGENNKGQYSLTLPNGEVKTFSLSLGDMENALYCLVNDAYSELDNDIYSVVVYPDDKQVVMCGWFSGACYRQSYKRKKDNFSLEGERVSVHQIFVSDDEQKVLDDMKANYSVMETKIVNYEAEPEKIKLLNSEEYNGIKSTKEYTEISKRENYFDLDKEDLTKKLDEIMLSYAKKNQLNFSLEENNGEKKVGIVPIMTTSKVSNYGSLLKDI